MNFDADRFPYYIETAYKYREELKQAYEDACKAKGVTPKQFTQSEATWMPEGDLWTGPTESLEAEGEILSLEGNINPNESSKHSNWAISNYTIL